MVVSIFCSVIIQSPPSAYSTEAQALAAPSARGPQATEAARAATLEAPLKVIRGYVGVV